MTHLGGGQQYRLSSCPQHDVLWPELTAREHLEFYGRVKQIKARMRFLRVHKPAPLNRRCNG